MDRSNERFIFSNFWRKHKKVVLKKPKKSKWIFVVFSILWPNRASNKKNSNNDFEAWVNTVDLRYVSFFSVKYIRRYISLKKKRPFVFSAQYLRYATAKIGFLDGFELAPTSSFNDIFISKIARRYTHTHIYIYKYIYGHTTSTSKGNCPLWGYAHNFWTARPILMIKVPLERYWRLLSEFTNFRSEFTQFRGALPTDLKMGVKIGAWLKPEPVVQNWCSLYQIGVVFSGLSDEDNINFEFRRDHEVEKFVYI